MGFLCISFICKPGIVISSNEDTETTLNMYLNEREATVVKKIYIYLYTKQCVRAHLQTQRYSDVPFFCGQIYRLSQKEPLIVVEKYSKKSYLCTVKNTGFFKYQDCYLKCKINRVFLSNR